MFKVEEMTLEQKLGFVYCVRRFQEDDIKFTIDMIKKRAIGCIQLPERYPETRILSQFSAPSVCSIRSAIRMRVP